MTVRGWQVRHSRLCKVVGSNSRQEEIHIIDKVEELRKNGKEPEYESLSLQEFLVEFEYATKYLSRFLKVRGFMMYMLFFKRAYFIEGNRKVSIKLSNLGQNMLSDLGQPMSYGVVRRGVNDLVKFRHPRPISDNQRLTSYVS